MPPFVGALWTPGYWGPAVGYYGDIDSGYGYTGDGYRGGYWNVRHFYYNRTVNNTLFLNITCIHNMAVDEHFRERHTSFHGGPGGTSGQPTCAELAAARQRRSEPVGA